MKIIKKLKQTTAMLLAAGMVVTGLPTGVLEARADVLAPNTSIGDGVPTDNSNRELNRVNGFIYGSSDSTSFVYGKSAGHNSTNTTGVAAGADQVTFNVAAITDDSLRSNTSRM